jgi:hypothetical protein
MGHRTFFLAAGLVAVASCAPQEPVACTMIGCDDGWSVEVVGELPATYVVRARVDGEVVASRECSPANPCAGAVFLPGISAAEAELEIVGDGVDLRWTVRPEYQVVQPNGPNCPPICQQARVRVEL